MGGEVDLGLDVVPVFSRVGSVGGRGPDEARACRTVPAPRVFSSQRAAAKSRSLGARVVRKSRRERPFRLSEAVLPVHSFLSRCPRCPSPVAARGGASPSQLGAGR